MKPQRKGYICRTKEFDRPRFCESYYAYKKLFIEGRYNELTNKELNKAVYVKRGFDYYCKNMWRDYIASVRGVVYSGIKRQGWKKDGKTQDILGCDFETFKRHIEKQFTKGMNWDNQGKWHFDHIYPVSLARDQKHVIELNHYTNFQPLWAKDNIKKGNRL
jgi:hypothetical protein